MSENNDTTATSSNAGENKRSATKPLYNYIGTPSAGLTRYGVAVAPENLTTLARERGAQEKYLAFNGGLSADQLQMMLLGPATDGQSPEEQLIEFLKGELNNESQRLYTAATKDAEVAPLLTKAEISGDPETIALAEARLFTAWKERVENPRSRQAGQTIEDKLAKVLKEIAKFTKEVQALAAKDPVAFAAAKPELAKQRLALQAREEELRAQHGDSLADLLG